MAKELFFHKREELINDHLNIWAQFSIYRNVLKNHSFDKLIQFWKMPENWILSLLLSPFYKSLPWVLNLKHEPAWTKSVLCGVIINHPSLFLDGSSLWQLLYTCLFLKRKMIGKPQHLNCFIYFECLCRLLNISL